jgi:hypothetical protein
MAEVVLQGKYSFETAEGLNIYRLAAPDVDEESIRRVGGRFGLAGTIDAGTFVSNRRSLSYSEPSGWGLQLFRDSGGWKYLDATRWQAHDGAGDLDIEDDEAEALARDVVVANEVADASTLELERVERLHVAHSSRDGSGHEEYTAGARVLLRRVVDGISTVGPGGRTIVYLDAERALTGVEHLWHEIESVHAPVQGLRELDDAFEEIRARYQNGDGRAEVFDVSLGYYEQGFDGRQEFLQPAYVFLLRLTSPDPRFRINASAAVSAAINAPVPVEAPVSPPAAQPARSAE